MVEWFDLLCHDWANQDAVSVLVGTGHCTCGASCY